MIKLESSIRRGMLINQPVLGLMMKNQRLSVNQAYLACTSLHYSYHNLISQPTFMPESCFSPPSKLCAQDLEIVIILRLNQAQRRDLALDYDPVIRDQIDIGLPIE